MFTIYLFGIVSLILARERIENRLYTPLEFLNTISWGPFITQLHLVDKQAGPMPLIRGEQEAPEDWYIE